MSNRSTVSALFGAVLIMGAGLSGQAMAKGCLKGAAVGGVAGHMAGHHGVMGAAAGCAVGHHEAAKKAKADAAANPPS
ncbi:hypothetical protein NFI95_10115 [Acetobacteraceae bacterium KSS8]|uniref:Glycine zipper 2TM domain protein n=1 Tax=Endosaccharibacter trunci TaxID=2812733 RepID=A0ABT1W989_9PROT|nr:hypothetical protein [Acetobacteraceae bacterium KSS8]